MPLGCSCSALGFVFNLYISDALIFQIRVHLCRCLCGFFGSDGLVCWVRTRVHSTGVLNLNISYNSCCVPGRVILVANPHFPHWLGNLPFFDLFKRGAYSSSSTCWLQVEVLVVFFHSEQLCCVWKQGKHVELGINWLLTARCLAEPFSPSWSGFCFGLLVCWTKHFCFPSDVKLVLQKRLEEGPSISTF